MKNTCPLCKGIAGIFYEKKNQLFYLCVNCKGIFLQKNLLPDRKKEIERYLSHNNDIEDERYQTFVSPIVSSVLRDFTATCKGLDFGAGTGPVITKLLQDNKFQIAQYDPFFHNYPAILAKKYNYIICCEVIEHFHDPKKEFSLLKELLLKNGKIYCMTGIYNKSINFGNWSYKNDITHVFIYQKETFLWIKDKFGFTNVTIDGRLITFYN